MPRKLPHPINKEEFLKLLEESVKQREKYRKKRSKKLTPKGNRINQYIISMVFGFGSGMRISEVVGWKHIPPVSSKTIEEKVIRVFGKGGKSRIVPLPTKLFQKVGITRSMLMASIPIYTSYRALEYYVTAIGKKVLNKHITFHTLRHGFATHCIEKEMDLPQLQQLMGHSRLDTTGIYLHVNPKKAIEKYEEVF